MKSVNCEDCIHSVINVLTAEFAGDEVCGCIKHDIFMVASWECHKCKDFEQKED